MLEHVGPWQKCWRRTALAGGHVASYGPTQKRRHLPKGTNFIVDILGRSLRTAYNASVKSVVLGS